MSESAREKISMFSNVDINQVISMPDVNNIYKVPLILFERNIAHWLAEKFSLLDLRKKLVDSNTIWSRNNSMNADEILKSQHLMQKWIELHDRFVGFL